MLKKMILLIAFMQSAHAMHLQDVLKLNFKIEPLLKVHRIDIDLLREDSESYARQMRLRIQSYWTPKRYDFKSNFMKELMEPHWIGVDDSIQNVMASSLFYQIATSPKTTQFLTDSFYLILLKKASEAGHAKAQMILSDYYYNLNSTLADDYLLKAVSQGLPEALKRLLDRIPETEPIYPILKNEIDDILNQKQG